ncbi:MAG: ATP-dependent DNA helicase RecG [Lachnospiraceae bacterium]
MQLSSPLKEVKGIGAKTEKLFQKLNIYTVGDLLLYYPRDYIKFPEVTFPAEAEEGKMCAIEARIRKTPLVVKTSKMPVTTAEAVGDGVCLNLTWFRMSFLKNSLRPGGVYVFYGKVTYKGNQPCMEQPTVYTVAKYKAIENQMQPVYPLVKGITNNLIIKTVKQILQEDQLFTDYLPSEMRLRHTLCELNFAMEQIHFPDSMENLIEARKRLVFDEFFLFILGMQIQKDRDAETENSYVFQDSGIIDRVMKELPYELTNAQKAALLDVRTDMSSAHVMQRLVQGDVGSGKTIVAYLAMLEAAENGYQSAIMVPTEVLARQHYENFKEMNEQHGIKHPVILLTGSLTVREKRRAYERMALYPDAMIVGTHALIQDQALFDNLALVITDEQHRFGVRQRETLSQKGMHPHVLVMSATPIPRTLAIIMYGDLDISVIDEVPARRLPIKNCVVGPNYRKTAYRFMEKEIRAGHQVYVICPLVEETENSGEMEDVLSYTERLREIFPPDIQVQYLHGKLASKDKNAIMEAFEKNEIQVLVSTTVVEVGVNVPNATVMMIENAERFGLAQLHQLRGRVGRGDAQSYCIFINGSDSKHSQKRLDILNKSNDGFLIASEDLKLRGPGDFFGIRQSGEMNFKLADIYQDATVMQRAAEEVKALLSSDPALEQHPALLDYLKQQYLSEDGGMNL